MAFATQPFVVESGLYFPERQLKSVELVAFLSSDMEDEFRDSLESQSETSPPAPFGDAILTLPSLMFFARFSEDARHR